MPRGIDAVAQSGPYTRVVTTCAACGQANPDAANFCIACGAALAPKAAGPPEERRVVTAVFTDIVGSTATAERLDPEDVHSRLSPYFARARQELERVGGSVEKFIGDAVVAVFGAPTAHEDDPERAVRAALAIRAAMDELNEDDPWLDLHVRVGVASGEALVVLDRDVQSGEGIASGDVMNTAARIQSGAPQNGVLVDEGTYRATSDAIEYRPAEPLAAKGKTEPVAVWEAVGIRTVPGHRPPSRTPFVGRARELEQLEEIWTLVRLDRWPAMCTVLAAPGVGKSRLLGEFEARSLTGASVYRGRCLPYGEGITYWPVAQIIRRIAGILGSDGAEVISTKLGALLESLPTERPDELRTIASALANLIGVARTPAGTYSAAQITQAELHWGIRRLFELLAERGPLVVVFEDLHWAEDTLLDLVRFLTDGSTRVPLLVLGTARPELAERGPAILIESERRLVLELEPLTPTESELLVSGLAEAHQLPADSLEPLLRHAQGNPLFVEETVRMHMESPPADDQRPAVPVPTSLQALLGARLDQLPADERTVAQHASVVGTVFWPGALGSLDGGDHEAIANALERLEARDVIRSRPSSIIAGEREYGFKHILIRDVAYARIPKGRRVVLHSRFATWVDDLPSPDEELVEIVAYHLEQACQAATELAHSPEPPPILAAAGALARAAVKAERREGFREADSFYARALAVLGEVDGQDLVELQLERARTLAALGDLATAHDQLLAVAEAAASFGRLDLRCAALIAVANIDTKQGRAAQTRRNLTEAVAIASEIGDQALQVRALYEFARFVAWFEGASEAAASQLREALAIAEALDDRSLRIEGHMRIGSLCFNVGDLAGAEAECERCAELASELGSFRDETRSITLLSLVRYYRGQIDEAEELALQALEWLERTADTYLQLQNLRELARCALARGDLDLAEERLRKAVPLALEFRGWLVIEIYRYLTETLVRQGRVEEARELVEFAARNLPDEDAYAQAALCLAQASVATADGERAGAVARFDEALRLLREQRLLTDLGEARIALARALRSFGETADARAELERAREEFDRMDARELVAQIDRELMETVVTEADSVSPRHL
jgi:class 3 adenylate cyclase/tetratricopeptide (TPR) repeat protein